jgi:hypothetical protein
MNTRPILSLSRVSSNASFWQATAKESLFGYIIMQSEYSENKILLIK